MSKTNVYCNCKLLLGSTRSWKTLINRKQTLGGSKAALRGTHGRINLHTKHSFAWLSSPLNKEGFSGEDQVSNAIKCISIYPIKSTVFPNLRSYHNHRKSWLFCLFSNHRLQYLEIGQCRVTMTTNFNASKKISQTIFFFFSCDTSCCQSYLLIVSVITFWQAYSKSFKYSR